jgi:hypothetical protein
MGTIHVKLTVLDVEATLAGKEGLQWLWDF